MSQVATWLRETAAMEDAIADDLSPKPATTFTAAANNAAVLNFDDAVSYTHLTLPTILLV